MNIDLKGKTALVTGGSRGLGLGISQQLALSGASVWINDIDAEAAKAAQRNLAASGLTVQTVLANVADRDEVTRMREAVTEKSGGVDILVNNAGIGDFVGWRDITAEKWEAMLSVHLTGTFNCCQLFLPAMISRGWGRVVNISSVAGKRGDFMGNAHYTAAKAGIIGLTRSLAADVAAKGVTVNSVAPGLIETDLTSGMSSEMRRETEARIPLRRLGTPSEIAAAVTFLASEQASYIVGETISVNGGSYFD
jgi:NAD(P)-dependent dehydrogenase (short-subunit alcohol dehydrogenase family)